MFLNVVTGFSTLDVAESGNVFRDIREEDGNSKRQHIYVGNL